MMTTSAQMFCDAMSARRYIARHFYGSDQERLNGVMAKLGLDFPAIQSKYLIGAQAESNGYFYRFVDGSMARSLNGIWAVAR